MGSYEVEHGISLNAKPNTNKRRPDMSTFMSKFSEVKTGDDASRTHNNAHAVPTPVDVASLFHLLADGYTQIRGDTTNPGHQRFLDGLIEELRDEAEEPPKKIEGVPQSFLDSLDRVPNKQLKKNQVCPICGEAFLDDPHPLVVELPCHDTHRFDLECIAPWLKLQGTCPLDRKDVMKRKIEIPADDDEEDYDDQIA